MKRICFLIFTVSYGIFAGINLAILLPPSASFHAAWWKVSADLFFAFFLADFASKERS